MFTLTPLLTFTELLEIYTQTFSQEIYGFVRVNCIMVDAVLIDLTGYLVAALLSAETFLLLLYNFTLLLELWTLLLFKHWRVVWAFLLFMFLYIGTPLCFKDISWSKHAVSFSLFSDFFVFLCTGDVSSTDVNTKNIFGLTSKLLYRNNWLKNRKERQLICGLRWGNIYTQCFFTDSWSFFILLWCL